MSLKSTKSYCQTCEFETNHTVLKDESINGNEEYHFQTNYMIVGCKGCDTISFRQEYIDYENASPDEDGKWHPEITIDTFPKEERRQKLNRTWILPEKIEIVYRESIKAFNSNCYLLSGVGFRAVIEAICLDKQVPGRDLAKKIDNLTKQKLITEKEAQRLHSIRFMGNDSVHEMNVPEQSKLLIVLNIIEHLLNNLYIIDYEIRNNLETVIGFYSEFEILLNLNLKNMEIGDEFPLAKILGKSIRRLHGKVNDFQSELITQINNGNYTKLSIGRIATHGTNQNLVQHFVKTGV